MRTNLILMFLVSMALCISLLSCQRETFEVSITPNLEDVTDNGYRFTPSTQSFIRGYHWLEGINKATVMVDDKQTASIDFINNDASGYTFGAKNIPLKYLVPRLHYKIEGSPDDFDLFNLMLAEFSRNGLSFPSGKDGDEITHFETNLIADIPWKLVGDFDFQPNPTFKPLRFSVVNNCLSSCLWELNAVDKTGEIYHSWFTFPEDQYFQQVAITNGISEAQAREALKWKEDEFKIDLDRLRSIKKEIGYQPISVVDEEISYSTQGSRQKLSKGFVTYQNEEGAFVRPTKLSDLWKSKVKMSKFEKPGKYRISNKMEFDFQPYKSPRTVSVKEVDPLTSYSFTEGPFKRDDKKYIELEIELKDGRKLIVGNLPLYLLVQQEDYPINGFGVGILSAGGFAERRQLLINYGHHPSYAYLVKETSAGQMALNSHDEGLEQVFIRSYPHADQPHWDVTFTSYERITDIVKYRIPIPQEFIEEQRQHTDKYITPVYFSYRDDNIR